MFHIPLNTEIIPYNSRDGKKGFPRLTSIEVSGLEKDILEELELSDSNGNLAIFCRLSLEDNPSSFDSYLVLKSNIIWE